MDHLDTDANKLLQASQAAGTFVKGQAGATAKVLEAVKL